MTACSSRCRISRSDTDVPRSTMTWSGSAAGGAGRDPGHGHYRADQHGSDLCRRPVAGPPGAPSDGDCGSGEIVAARISDWEQMGYVVMPRHRSVERILAASYLAAGSWGCGRFPGSVVPSGAVPATAEAAAAWMAETHNDQAVLHQFRWKFREGTGG